MTLRAMWGQASLSVSEVLGEQAMRTEIPSTRHAPEPQTSWSPRKRIRTAELMQGAREVIIVHEGEEYLLRITKTGKLILTK
jgi:hemin uptake protein HemP